MIKIFDNIDTLIENAARLIGTVADKAFREQGRFVMALSGGNSPRPLFQLLTKPPYRETIRWKHSYVLWSDERYVPLDDKRSNAGNAYELLLKHVPVPDDHLFTMYDANKSPEEAARDYESKIIKIFGKNEPRLDLTLLGCGSDGHTASLFPGSQAVNENKSLVVAVDHGERELPRISLTPPLLNSSGVVLFIVYGADKSRAVHEVLEGNAKPEDVPARIIKPKRGEIFWFLDQKAAAGLTLKSL
jgi:6-phosphogluconolactonase